jgi:hypothetical protein
MADYTINLTSEPLKTAINTRHEISGLLVRLNVGTLIEESNRGV